MSVKRACNRSFKNTTAVTKPGTKDGTKPGNFDITAIRFCNQVSSEVLHHSTPKQKKAKAVLNTGKRQSITL